jgi:autotransporter-associated beta strand protein
MIGRASDSTVNQNAGSFTDNTITSLGQWGHTGILNLNGGVYSTFSVQAGYLNDPTAKGKIVFDGGTLKANVNSFYYNAELNTCNLINPYEGTMEVLVRAGGAVIDSSTMNASVLVPLLEDPASIGGGLTKKGDGVLNLVAGNTYSGDTVVEAGTLNVPSLNTPSATVYVGEGATLVTASLVADTLNIGSLPGAAAPTAVPEPGTLALLALAGLALAGAYLRRG